METIMFSASDNTLLSLNKWTPEKQETAKAVVQIVHGLAEHSMRYRGFAEELVHAGFIVYANDHRGHGLTAQGNEELGCFSDENGWQKAVDDIYRISMHIKREHPNLPLFLFGHSMGSFISRSYICQYGQELKGVVLSGTGGNPGFFGRIGYFIARLEMKKRGRRAYSPLMHKLGFGSYNDKFKPNKTAYDWLSRNEEEVFKYCDDPLCGFPVSVGLYYDLLGGILGLYKQDPLNKIPKDLPIFIMSGDKDPVGNSGKGVLALASLYKGLGIEEVEYKLYKDGRHEMLNEVNKHEVYDDIIGWLCKHIGS